MHRVLVDSLERLIVAGTIVWWVLARNEEDWNRFHRERKEKSLGL